MLVSFANRACTSMTNELRRYPDLETGGLLLGYAEDGKYIKVLEATDGGYCNTIRTEKEFQYNYDYERHICEILSEMYIPTLNIVGVWHKHNQINEAVFSQADEKIHQQLLNQKTPCISVLFEKTLQNEDVYNLRCFLLQRKEPHREIVEGLLWDEP